MSFFDDFLLQIGCNPTPKMREQVRANPEPMLAAMVEMMAEPHAEHVWKMMRTRWRTADIQHTNDSVYVGLSGFRREKTFLDTFDRHFAPRLGVRGDSFRKVFERVMNEGVPAPLIIETGCLRIPGNWELDGQSTFMLDEFALQHDGFVVTIDIAPESIDTARRACSQRTACVLADSVSFLHQLAALSKKRAALVFLDSFDVDPNDWMPSAIHHMKELCAIWPLLGTGSVVCIDDYGGGRGKGTLIDDFFNNLNMEVIVEGVQKAWIISD